MVKYVNVWGEYIVNDIIDGIKVFLDKYSYVDSKCVGNLGVFYGGFMIMLLVIKIDMFSVFIVYVGILNIILYWG